MPAATLTEKGQIVIPADIRARYELTAGTQLEFVDDNGSIRLLIRRRVPPTDPASGYGMVKVKASRGKPPRRLRDFDPASLVRASKKRS
ncbi:MAG: AbrB/MazE/SpoVT family DNA-binding domain-containing protein [Gammaproteobacteria bacterium]